MLTATPVAMPPQPLMLSVSKPAFGVAVHVVLPPEVTATLAPPPQSRLPFAPALALTVYCRGAAQLAVLPPLSPAQLQVNDALPAVTLLAVPALHKFALGVVTLGTPLAVPQTPLTATATSMSFCGAGAMLPLALPALPTCDARTPHRAAASGVTTPAAVTVHVPGVHVSNVTARPLLAVALRLTGAPTANGAGGTMLIVCPPRTLAGVGLGLMVPALMVFANWP